MVFGAASDDDAREAEVMNTIFGVAVNLYAAYDILISRISNIFIFLRARYLQSPYLVVYWIEYIPTRIHAHSLCVFFATFFDVVHLHAFCS